MMDSIKTIGTDNLGVYLHYLLDLPREVLILARDGDEKALAHIQYMSDHQEFFIRLGLEGTYKLRVSRRVLRLCIQLVFALMAGDEEEAGE